MSFGLDRKEAMLIMLSFTYTVTLDLSTAWES